MTQDDLALRIAGLRPGETPFLQPLGTDPESATIPDQDLQAIALGVAEQEEVPAQRLTRQSIPDQTVKPLEPLAHVGDSGGQIDPRGWTQSEHCLHPLQRAHQALEGIRIIMRMYLDPARPTAPRLGRNSVRAASAISYRPTPLAPTGRLKKLFYSFSSSVVSSDDDQACRSSNPDSGKTRRVACRCL